MNLRKTRSIISLLITLLFSLSISCACGTVLLNATFANASFMEQRFVTDKLAEECEAQLNLQFEALAVKSGIPARVFRNIENEISVKETLRTSVNNFYSHIDTQAAKATKADYFYNICTEYLDGNNLSYNEQDIRNASAEAAEIYENCIGLSNTEHLIDFTDRVNANAPDAALGFFMGMLLFGALFFVLYKSRSRAFSYVASGISVSGATLVFISLFSIIFKVGTRFAMTPQAHYASMCSVIRLFFILLFAFGVLLIALGTVLNVMIYNKEKKDKR